MELASGPAGALAVLQLSSGGTVLAGLPGAHAKPPMLRARSTGSKLSRSCKAWSYVRQFFPLYRCLVDLEVPRFVDLAGHQFLRPEYPSLSCHFHGNVFPRIYAQTPR